MRLFCRRRPGRIRHPMHLCLSTSSCFAATKSPVLSHTNHCTTLFPTSLLCTNELSVIVRVISLYRAFYRPGIQIGDLRKSTAIGKRALQLAKEPYNGKRALQFAKEPYDRQKSHIIGKKSPTIGKRALKLSKRASYFSKPAITLLSFSDPMHDAKIN